MRSSQRLPGTMNFVIFMSFLHAAVLAQDGNISCNIPPVEPMAATSLTCTFPEDISLSKKDFSVVHMNNTNKPVLDCLWIRGNLECFDKPGYTFNRTVTNQLAIVIPQAFSNMTGDYYCKVSDSTNFKIQHCQLDFRPETNENGNESNTKNDTQESNGSLAIGLSIGLVCLTAIAIAVVILLLRRRRRLERGKKRKDSGQNPGAQLRPLIKAPEEFDNIDANFERYLKETVLEMYPEKSCYFVPPIYFNRCRYLKRSYAGEDIYVREAADEDVKHDRAMQHVLHCLRQLAEKEQEQMFVLTQFKYEDYLKSANAPYAQHSLPMPAGLKDVDVNIGCFDFLIVHRHHGVLVGVVKAVSDNDVKKANDKKKTADNVVFVQVDEAVQQLKKAEDMIRYLMSADMEVLPKIRQTLILPNLSRTLLRSVTSKRELIESLRQRVDIGPYDDPVDECLCSDDLSGPKTPWEVKPKVVANMKKRWNWMTSPGNVETRMNDDLYLNIIARFFGPATQSKLKFKDDQEEILPKILAEAVSLTGDLYSSTMLDEDPEPLLDQSILYLVGPPNTGKTRMLTLAGRKWLSDRHDVFIVKDTTSKSDPFLSQHLNNLIGQMDEEVTGETPHVYDEKCDLTSKTSIEDCVNSIIAKWTRKKKEKICILLDVAHLKGKHVNKFKNTLDEKETKRPYLLWVSCSSDMDPDKGYVRKRQEILNCPPAVIRENPHKKKDAKQAHDSLRPTDGPPVKHINYKLPLVSPQESRELGKMVGDFLAKNLLVTRTDQPAWKKVQALPLTHKDIFILFESNSPVSEDSGFLSGLRDNNIIVRPVKIEDDTVVVDETINTAWAMNVAHVQLYRKKRKIVVYVQSHFKDEENKQRAITSCTSQLILVQPTAMF